MKRYFAPTALLVVLAGLPALAEDSVWIDLSGKWKLHCEDRPAYASPAFDDSQWEDITVPRGAAFDRGTCWLRRHLDLPARTGLTLTIGLAESYQVYWNGTKIGETNEWGRYDQAVVPRPRSFPLPGSVLAPGSTVIALRVVHALNHPPMMRLPDEGPWLVSDTEHTPAGIGRPALERQVFRYTPTLIFGVVLFAAAVLSFLAWMSDRRRFELAWFSATCLELALEVAWIVLAVLGEGHTYSRAGLSWTALTTVFNPLNCCFALSVCGVRRRTPYLGIFLVWSIIPVALVTATGIADFSPRMNGSVSVLLLATSLYVAFDLLRTYKSISWQERLLRMAVLVPLVTGVMTWSQRFLALSLPRMATGGVTANLLVGPWHVEREFALQVLVSIVLLILMLRRVAADLRDKQRLARELEAARSVQQLLVGGEQIEGIEAVYRPAAEVGGDFYQVLPLEGGSTLVAVGDVSGKGLKAAMVVSMAVAVLRLHRDLSPAALLAQMNRALTGSLEGGFVTCILLRITPDGGTTTAANAGHLLPYRNGEDVPLDSGLPLGIAVDATWTETELAAGEWTLVSDGVIEAANAKGELFGFDRTAALSTKSAAEIAEAARAWGQNDDITVVTVRRANA